MYCVILSAIVYCRCWEVKEQSNPIHPFFQIKSWDISSYFQKTWRDWREPFNKESWSMLHSRCDMDMDMDHGHMDMIEMMIISWYDMNDMRIYFWFMIWFAFFGPCSCSGASAMAFRSRGLGSIFWWCGRMCWMLRNWKRWSTSSRKCFPLHLILLQPWKKWQTTSNMFWRQLIVSQPCLWVARTPSH